MSHQQNTAENAKEKLLPTLAKDLPRINLRPFVYTALGVIFGIFLYCRCRFGGLRASDFLFFVLLFALSFRPISPRRAAVIVLCFLVFAGAGAGLMHAATQRYLSGMGAGEYKISGTVSEINVENGYSGVTLDTLSFDGTKTGGKMKITVSTEELRPGDRIVFTATVSHTELPSGNGYRDTLFVKDVRYETVVYEYEMLEGKGNALLRLNGKVYDALHTHMQKTQADTAYALLTGSTGNLDDGFSLAVKQGGIAHIFAVSGLHIGILFSAVSFACRKLKGFRLIPAVALALLYSAFCGFSISSLRAVVMCTAVSAYTLLKRKYDFLSCIGFASTLLLLVRPAEWLSAGFRLSFGACVGLALFSGTLRRAMKKLPGFLSDYLSANFAVQLFTFPVLFDTFGYCSVWGTLLNFFLIPALPALFLGLFLCTVLAVLIPPAAGVFLAVPNGMITLLLYVFSVADFSFVITGFSLGTGSAVWIASACFLSERVRFSWRERTAFASVAAAAFTVCVLLRNVVFTGCKLISEKELVLVQTKNEHVLIVGNAKPAEVESFLMRNYNGKLTAVIVLSNDVMKSINAVVPFDCDVIHTCREISAGLNTVSVIAEERFAYGSLVFRYESAEKLTLSTENRVTEFDFTGEEALSADLYVTNGSATYFLKNGAVYTFG